MRRTGWLLIAVLLLSFSARAQDSSDFEDDEDEYSGPVATLNLNLGSDGVLRINFAAFQQTNAVGVRNALASTVHCPAELFQPPPEYDVSKLAYASHWTAEQITAYQKSAAEYRQHSLIGECSLPSTRTLFLQTFSVDYQQLGKQLAPLGVQQLWISIELPRAEQVEFSREYLHRESHQGWTVLTYHIPLKATSYAPVRVAYGLRAAKLYRAILFTTGFFFLPVALTLWMRRAALERGKNDPTAAWFGYFRVLNWCINGSALVWIVSGLGARQTLQAWLTFLTLPLWVSAVLDALIVIGPAFAIYFACVLLSYKLHVELRQRTWTKREFLLQQLTGIGNQAMPLIFLLGALSTLWKDGRTSAALFGLAWVTWIVCYNLRLRVNKAYPHALTTGELRDRVFELAGRAGVQVKQIYVLPTGKGQIANAYAATSRVVMFTDYLLQHLTKPEVDGVAAHELSHLQQHHVGKRVAAFYFALMLPALFSGFLQPFFGNTSGLLHPNSTVGHLYAAATWFWHWSQRDFILLLLGLAGFYFLSRRFEHEADRGAIALTGNPEAQITGLLKLSRLNLMPIQWGRGTGSMLTHPSTIKRAERIAAAGGMTAEQLQLLLANHELEAKRQPEATMVAVPALYYSVPETNAEHVARSAAAKTKHQQVYFWVGLLNHIIPAALAVVCVRVLHLQGVAAFAGYFAGALLTPVYGLVMGLHMSLMGRKKQAKLLVDRFRNDIPSDCKPVVVGFSPGALVRFYHLNYYSWDVGLLVLQPDGLAFLGEQIRFFVPATQIDGVCLGQGGASWWKFPRIYVRWVDNAGRPSVFSIASLEPCPLFGVRSQATELLHLVQSWRTSVGNESLPRSVLGQLPVPKLGQVTSIAPEELGSAKYFVRYLAFLLPMAALVSAALRIDSILYLFGVGLFTRIVDSIPYWRFHDRLLSFAEPASTSRAAAGNS